MYNTVHALHWTGAQVLAAPYYQIKNNKDYTVQQNRRVTCGKWCIRSVVPAGVENVDVSSYTTKCSINVKKHKLK
jgi:hypothetical protein